MEPATNPAADDVLADAISRLTFEIAERGSFPPQALAYLSERLRSEGYYPELNNFGATRCLLPGTHDSHGEECSSVGPFWARRQVRRFRTKEEGLSTLMGVAYHSTLSGSVQDLETCGVQVVKRYLRYSLGTQPWLRGIGICGSGCGCGVVVNVSSIDEMDFDLPKNIHGVSVDIVEVGNIYPHLRGETSGFAGYRSVESSSAPSPQIIPDDDEIDRLDGVFDKVQDSLIKSSVLSFCRGVLKDEKKIAGRIDGIADPVKDWMVRGIVLSFCRGEIKSSEAADKISGILDAVNPFAPSDESKAKVQEVAAQWTALKKKMDSNQKIAKVLKGHFDRWMEFWKKWQDDDRDVNAVRSIIAEVNAARADAEQIESGNVKFVAVQDVKNRTTDMSSENLTAARGAAQAATDAPDDLKAAIDKKLDDNKWKIAAAAVTAVVALGVGAKIATKL